MPVASSGHRPHRLIRRLLCVRGQVTFRVEVEPRFDYGRQAHRTPAPTGRGLRVTDADGHTEFAAAARAFGGGR